MTPADNVLYFNLNRKNIDIRLCLKNGYTTLRTAWVWSKANPSLNSMKKSFDSEFPGEDFHLDIFKRKGGIHCDGVGSTNYRYALAMLAQDIYDIPFRRNSYRIAIKRDPIKRFLSTLEYLEKVKNHERYSANEKKHYIDLTNLDITNVNHIIECLDNGKLRDEHFFPQSYFMGHRDQYHKVYDIQDLNILLQEIESWGVVMDLKLSDLKENSSPYKHKITLTPEQEARIIKLYAQDYANGWY